MFNFYPTAIQATSSSNVAKCNHFSNTFFSQQNNSFRFLKREKEITKNIQAFEDFISKEQYGNNKEALSDLHSLINIMKDRASDQTIYQQLSDLFFEDKFVKDNNKTKELLDKCLLITLREIKLTDLIKKLNQYIDDGKVGNNKKALLYLENMINNKYSDEEPQRSYFSKILSSFTTTSINVDKVKHYMQNHDFSFIKLEAKDKLIVALDYKKTFEPNPYEELLSLINKGMLDKNYEYTKNIIDKCLSKINFKEKEIFHPVAELIYKGELGRDNKFLNLLSNCLKDIIIFDAVEYIKFNLPVVEELVKIFEEAAINKTNIDTNLIKVINSLNDNNYNKIKSSFKFNSNGFKLFEKLVDTRFTDLPDEIKNKIFDYAGNYGNLSRVNKDFKNLVSNKIEIEQAIKLSQDILSFLIYFDNIKIQRDAVKEGSQSFFDAFYKCDYYFDTLPYYQSLLNNLNYLNANQKLFVWSSIYLYFMQEIPNKINDLKEFIIRIHSPAQPTYNSLFFNLSLAFADDLLKDDFNIYIVLCEKIFKPFYTNPTIETLNSIKY